LGKVERESMGFETDDSANLPTCERITEWYSLSTNNFVKPS